MIIKNHHELTQHGNTSGRQIVLDVLEVGLAAPDPYDNVRRIVRIERNRLIVGDPALSDPPGQAPQEFDLDAPRSIYVIGGGKVAQRMAEAVEEILGEWITDGQINAKKGDSLRLKRIPVTMAGHPLPDEESVSGAQRIVEIARKAQRGDIVFHCHSGGATALTALPGPGVSLADLRQVYRLLYFEAGASMPVANAVRNQLVVLHSRLARYTGDATVFHLLTQETPQGFRAHPFSTAPQGNGYATAIEVLRAYRCWDRVSESVRAYLTAADERYGHLRPEETAGKPHTYFRVMGPEAMLEAARGRAEALGLRAMILAHSLNDVEARPVGETLGHVAMEIEHLGQLVAPPCILICGGELLVTVGDATGLGGRNQEFVLAAATRISGSPNIVIASVDSEGGDGPTDAAGGIVDGDTLTRVQATGRDIAAELQNHNSYEVLRSVGDLIHTGVRGTNVRDLRLIYVGASQPPLWIEHGP
jgi:glycerate-2-kinase